MYCPKCGNQISDNSKFCIKCGTKIMIEKEKVKEQSENEATPITKQNKATNLLKSNLFLFALAIIFIFIFCICSSAIDKKRSQNNTNQINLVKSAYFDFLPEMTVGEIITEYYGEDYWIYANDDHVEFFGTNQKDNSGLALHFREVTSDNKVKIKKIMFHHEGEKAHEIDKNEFEKYMCSLYQKLQETNNSH